MHFYLQNKARKPLFSKMNMQTKFLYFEKIYIFSLCLAKSKMSHSIPRAWKPNIHVSDLPVKQKV